MSCIRSCYDKDSSNFEHDDCKTCIHGDRPQQRIWVGLTLEERDHLWEVSRAGLPRYNTFAGLVEAKLKEKNYE